MIAHAYKPKSPLVNFVELMWFHDGYRSVYKYERAVPHGAATLVINFAQREATFCGAHSAPFILETEKMRSHIGIAFKPGGAFPFVPLPAGELHNEVVPLDTLWGRQVFPLRDQLLEAPSAQAKFALLEQALLAHLSHSDLIHPAVRFAVEHFPQVLSPRPVSTVAEQVGLSLRRFNQIFDAQVGLSPKRFHRVQRFQRLLSQIYGQTTVDWADVACAHGYFDQAHLIHEFQELTGISPNSYLAGANRHMNHVVMDG
ncbi:MAG: AraC family transcriptional regulator [Caldilineaceae bacterium]